MTATPRQTFAIFCATGYDVRACNLTKDQAYELIKLQKSGQNILETIKALPGAILKGKEKKTIDFKPIYDEALAAGLQAGRECKPTPMIVQQHANVLNDKSAVVKQWHVPDGVCGFAWVIVKDGRSSFANWLRKNELGGRKAYYGGVYCDYNDMEFGQSYERKTACASAFAEVLGKHGIDARCESRLD